DAFRQGNFWRKGQGKADWRSHSHCGLQIEAYTPGADVTDLRDLRLIVDLVVVNGNRYMQSEASSGKLLLLWLGHAFLRSGVYGCNALKRMPFRSYPGQYPCWGQPWPVQGSPAP